MDLQSLDGRSTRLLVIRPRPEVAFLSGAFDDQVRPGHRGPDDVDTDADVRRRAFDALNCQEAAFAHFKTVVRTIAG